MGLLVSYIGETFPPESKFITDNIPDLSGKVMIVTGANTGIGKETAKALLAHNAKVYIAARNREKCDQAIKDLQEQTGREAIFLKLDLSDLRSVKAAAEQFQSQEKELHVLFNNAGVMAPPMNELTAQGYDLQVGINALAPFYFTKLLLPNLLAGAQSSPDRRARIVNTSSFLSRISGVPDFNTFKDTPARRKKGNQMMYAVSKLCLVLFSNELARKYGNSGIVSTSLHPGTVASELQRSLSWFQKLLIKPTVSPTPKGALTQLWAGTSPEGAGFNGKYLVPWARIGESNPLSDDPKIAEDLWNWMEDQVANIKC